MNDTEFRVLITLSEEIGNSDSISELTKKIKSNFGTADYKNTHNCIQNFAENNMIKFEKKGNSLITKLNFENNLLVDKLTEIEIIKKIKYLENNKKFQIIFSELIFHAKEFKQLKTLIFLDPKNNLKLNKIELLMIINNNEIKNETRKINKIFEQIKKKHNIELTNLIIEKTSFINYLKSQEANIIKEILKNKIVLFGSQTLWIDIREGVTNGFNIKSEEKTDLNNISRQEILFNLIKFGVTNYEEELTKDTQISLEYIITIILLKKEFNELVKAIPIIILKNIEKINFNLLIYLTEKYGISNKLFNIFKTINEIIPNKKIKDAIKKIPHKKLLITDSNAKEFKEIMIQYSIIKED